MSSPWGRIIAGMAMAVLSIALSTAAIRIAYGALQDRPVVYVDLDRAGQGLRPESEVLVDGVVVGEVHDIELTATGVRVGLQLEEGVSVPLETFALVQPKTLFGEREVALFPTDGGPVAADGDVLAVRGAVSTEVEELVDGLADLLDETDEERLAAFLVTMRRATDDLAEPFARSLDSGEAVLTLLAETSDDQQRTIVAAAELATRVAAISEDLNAISRDVNVALPTLNAAEPDLRALLVQTQPVAEQLAVLLDDLQPSLDRILDDGGNVLRTLLADERDLRDLLEGVALYMFGAADNGVSPEVLPDGSRFGYFSLLMDARDINDLVCFTFISLGPDGAPLVVALEETGSFDCDAADRGEPAQYSVSAQTVQERLRGSVDTTLSTPDAGLRGGPDALLDSWLAGVP